MEHNRQILDAYSEKYLEGTLTPEEDQELASILAADRDLLEEFLTIVNLDADLAEVMGENTDSRGMASAVMTRISCKGKSERISRAVVDRISARQKGIGTYTQVFGGPNTKTRRFLLWFAAAACALITVFGYQMGFFHPEPADALACIRNISGNVKASGGTAERDLANGDPVYRGETLTPASDTVNYELYFPDDKTVFYLKNGTGAACIGGTPPVIEIENGRLYAVIQKNGGPHPCIRTVLAELSVSGTEFRMNAAERFTELYVIEGSVNFRDRENGKTVEVNQGLSLTKTEGAEAFTAELKMFETFEGSFGKGWMNNTQEKARLTFSQIPEGFNTSGAMRVDYTGMMNRWGWAGNVEMKKPADWTEYDGIRFAFRGSGSGNVITFEILEASKRGGPLERYVFEFTDDTEGWRIMPLLFTSFKRRRYQEPGAPDDGFNRKNVTGWGILVYGRRMAGSKGWFIIDSLELFTRIF